MKQEATMGSTKRFKTNMSKLRGDSDSFSTGGGDTNWFKMADGKHLVRILPPWAEDETFYKKVGYHRPPGRDNMSLKVVCPDYTFGTKGKCPICKARARVYKDLGKDEARPYAVQRRALLNVLDMKKADGNVYVLEAPATVMNPILNFMAEEDSDQLVDPEAGFNVLINRKKESGFTKYEVMVKPGTYNLSDNDYDVDEILENLNDLDKFIKEPDDDDFQEILDLLNEAAYGDAGGGESEEDDDAPPRKLKSAKVANGKADDDDEDDPPPSKIKKKSKPVAEEEEEEDDDTPPPPKKKKPQPVEEEEDEEEEEEEPAPKKTLKKKAAPVEDDEDDEPAPPKKKAKAAPIDDDEDESLDDIEGFDADEEIPF